MANLPPDDFHRGLGKARAAMREELVSFFQVKAMYQPLPFTPESAGLQEMLEELKRGYRNVRES